MYARCCASVSEGPNQAGIRPFDALLLAVGLVTWGLVLAWLWGFTVDDAWIVSRVAHHGAVGPRFSFNADGPVSDAVTPLGFARLLAVVGRCCGAVEPLQLFALARWLGLVATVSTGVALVGVLLAQAPRRLPVAVLLVVLVLSLPIGAWAGAGLSAPLVGLVVTVGLLVGHRWTNAAALLLGLAVAWRPELLPFAVTSLLVRPAARRKAALALLVAPSFVIVVVRWLLFDHVLPLAAIAKPPDLDSGLRYAVGTLLFAGPFVTLLSKRANWTLPRKGAPDMGWAWPYLAHLVALVAAGGDWMAFYRLSVPVLPWLGFLVAGDAAGHWRSWLRLGAGLVGSVLLLVYKGPGAGDVLETRLEWIRQARPVLETTGSVATVDIGWVGMATDARIVDLAGVTDPRIARLPGGHTSKSVPSALLAERDVRRWVVRTRSASPGSLRRVSGDERDRLQPSALRPSYVVDLRLLATGWDLGFAPWAQVPRTRGEGEVGYVIWGR